MKCKNYPEGTNSSQPKVPVFNIFTLIVDFASTLLPTFVSVDCSPTHRYTGTLFLRVQSYPTYRVFLSITKHNDCSGTIYGYPHKHIKRCPMMYSGMIQMYLFCLDYSSLTHFSVHSDHYPYFSFPLMCLFCSSKERTEFVQNKVTSNMPV